MRNNMEEDGHCIALRGKPGRFGIEFNRLNRGCPAIFVLEAGIVLVCRSWGNPTTRWTPIPTSIPGGAAPFNLVPNQDS